jgi:hypothetical protein
MNTLTTIDFHALAAVTGGADAGCTNLVEKMKGLIHDSYGHDDHAYAQRRMDSYGPALDMVRGVCERRKAADGDAPNR